MVKEGIHLSAAFVCLPVFLSIQNLSRPIYIPRGGYRYEGIHTLTVACLHHTRAIVRHSSCIPQATKAVHTRLDVNALPERNL